MVFAKYTKRICSEEKQTFWGFLFAFLFSLPLSFSSFPKLFFLPFETFILLLAFGIVGSIFTYGFYIYGIKHTDVSVAGIIFLLEPLFATLLAFGLLGEIPGIRVVIGGMLILISAGIVLKT